LDRVDFCRLGGAPSPWASCRVATALYAAITAYRDKAKKRRKRTGQRAHRSGTCLPFVQG
ncbi:MAG: hypothetical protein ACREX8_21460, partial [Gammaproteobacteria bacterium]